MDIHFSVHPGSSIGFPLTVVKHVLGLIEQNLFPNEINMLSGVEQGYPELSVPKPVKMLG